MSTGPSFSFDIQRKRPPHYRLLFVSRIAQSGAHLGAREISFYRARFARTKNPAHRPLEAGVHFTASRAAPVLPVSDTFKPTRGKPRLGDTTEGLHRTQALPG